ncbi:hypothetical protein F5Y06DRAFT_307690 [Hypoxylon sp. FL0890]|nr:hypothetical protein F5Y06DRAFT_307690 [Hypoxylon sp. FL0890]
MAPRKGNEAGKTASRTLKGCVIAIAVTLDDDWNEENVSRWTTLNGGTFITEVDESVTHVLATAEQYKKKVPTIKKALEFRAHIVTKDWLEDSLNKKRKLKEKEYSLEEDERKANAKKKREEKVQKGIEQAETFANPNLNHIYRDETFFPYEITLTRDDEEGGNVGQRYVLYLWESNSKPYLYRFMAKFYKKPRDSRPTIHRPRETPGPLQRELDDFKHFFRKKCGIKWDDRIAKAGTTPKNKFQYQPPTGGKPVGIVENPPPETWSIFGNGNVTAPAPAPAANHENLTNKRKHEADQDERAGKEKRQRRDAAPSPSSDLRTLKNGADEEGQLLKTSRASLAGAGTGRELTSLGERNKNVEKRQRTEEWVASSVSPTHDLDPSAEDKEALSDDAEVVDEDEMVANQQETAAAEESQSAQSLREGLLKKLGKE